MASPVVRGKGDRTGPSSTNFSPDPLQKRKSGLFYILFIQSLLRNKNLKTAHPPFPLPKIYKAACTHVLHGATWAKFLACCHCVQHTVGSLHHIFPSLKCQVVCVVLSSLQRYYILHKYLTLYRKRELQCVKQ